MEPLIAFRERLLFFQDPANGYRDTVRMSGAAGNGPLLMKGRKQVLKELLALQQQTGPRLVTDDELLLIQQHWKGARDPDDGRGVTRLVNEQRGLPMNDLCETSPMRRLESEVAEEKNLNPQTLQRLVAKVEEYSESHRAHGLQAGLVWIPQGDLRESAFSGSGR